MRLATFSHLYPNIADPLKGVFVAELVRALSRRTGGFVIAPVSSVPFLRPTTAVPLEDHDGAIPVFHPRYFPLPGVLIHQRWRTVLGALRRGLAAAQTSPDLIHSHWTYPDGYAAIRHAAGGKLPTVLTIHGHASLGLGLQGIRLPFHAGTLHATDRIIAVSAELAAILRDQFSVPQEKIRVIHNGIDPTRFHPGDRAQSSQRLGLESGRPLALTVARLSPEKRLDRLIDAFAHVRDPDLQLVILGNGPLHASLSARIDSLGFGGRIFLRGGIPHTDLPDWYRAADLFCLASEHEGCPVVVHEALACGVPVVSTPVGAVPDLLIPGKTGILSDPSAEGLANAIDEALACPWNRAAIAAEGARHTWDEVAERTVAIYRELVPT